MSRNLPNMSVRLSPEIRDLITRAARAAGMSRNAWMTDRLSALAENEVLAACTENRLQRKVCREVILMRLILWKFLEASYEQDVLRQFAQELGRETELELNRLIGVG